MLIEQMMNENFNYNFLPGEKNVLFFQVVFKDFYSLNVQ